MNKPSLILFIVLLALLCICLTSCSLFDKPDTPDDTEGTVYDLADLTVGADTFSFVYDGQPKTFDIKLYKSGDEVASVKAGEQHAELDVIFVDNVEIGTGQVVVKAKSGSKKFRGEVKSDFEILPASEKAYVGDFAALKQYLSKGAYSDIVLKNDIEIPENEKLTIYSTSKLDVGAHSLINRGELVNLGELEIGSFGMFDDSYYDFINYGKFVNGEGARFRFKVNGCIINHGQFEHFGEFTAHAENRRDNYLYSDVELDFTSSQSVKVFIRKSINSADVSLQSDVITYTGKPIVPSLNFSQIDVDYNVDCGNNINVGKYSAVFTATEHSKFFYGQRTFEYEIAPVPYETQYKETFLDKLSNPNYSPVTFNPKYKEYLRFDVLPNVTVNISNCSITQLGLGSDSKLNVYDEVSIGSSGAVTLNGASEINVYGSAVIYSSVAGTGKINIFPSGELYFYSESEPDVKVENEGSVYADFDLSAVVGGGSKTVRRNLSESEITVSTLEYTGKDLKVQTEFEHSEEKNYTVYYYIGDKFTSSEFPNDVGTYQAEVRFGERNKYYCGKVPFGFTVNKGKITVKNTSELLQAMDVGKYDRYELDCWQLDSSFEIGSGATVTVGTLINNGQLTVRGTLSVFNFTNNSGKSATVANGGTLSLRGDFYNIDVTSHLTVENGSVFENVGEGTVYLCEDDITSIIGQKIVRFNSLADAQFSNVSQAKYGENTTPTFELNYGGELVSQSEINVVYTGHANRTVESSAKIKISAKPNSQTYYGSVEYSYSVLGGKTIVSTRDEFLAALNNVTSDGICNWAEIETGAAISLKENNQSGKVDNYHVLPGTALIIKHNVGYWNNYPDKQKFSFKNDGVIEFHNGARLCDADLWQKNGTTGIFKLYVSSDADFKYYADGAKYDLICLKTSISLSANDSLEIYATNGNVVLDLNGFNIYGSGNNTRINLYTYGNIITLLGEGTIEPTVCIPSDTKYGNANGRVLLDNVTSVKTEDPCGIAVKV